MEQRLSNACRDGDLETVKSMVYIKGLNWNVKNNRVGGWSPLHAACCNGHVDIVCFLLTLNKVNAIEKHRHGNTPLHYACVFGYLSIVQILCTLKDVNVNERNHYGETPLHYAWQKKHLDIVRYLIEIEGAEYSSIENTEGSSPKDFISKKYKSTVNIYIGNISNNPNYSLSYQEVRCLQRSFEKRSISLLLRQDDTFNDIINRLFESEIDTADINSFAQFSLTIEDIASICSIVKMFIKKGTLTLKESSQIIEHIFGTVLDKKLIFMAQDYVSVKCLLDELKNQNYISEDNYLRWDRKILLINVETASTMNEKKLGIVVNNTVYEMLRKKYDELYNHYREFHNACKKKLEDEITFGLLRIGVSLLRLVPLMPDFNGLMDCALDISDPVQFCSIVIEKERFNVSVGNDSEEFSLKPIVKYILQRSKIEEKAFLSVLKDLLRTTLQFNEVYNGGNKVEPIGEIHSLTIAFDVKDRSDEISEMNDKISEVSFNQDGDKPIIEELSKKMSLVNLCNALKGMIMDDDFIGKLMDYQYIAALHFSKGNISIFKMTIKYISPDYSMNDRAKLCIKRDGFEDIESEITAIQYAAMCGYMNILEEYFLSKDQVDHIDFGQDNPVSYFIFTSNQQKLLMKARVNSN